MKINHFTKLAVFCFAVMVYLVSAVAAITQAQSVTCGSVNRLQCLHLVNPTISGATLTTGAVNGTVGATTPSTGAFTSVTDTLGVTGTIAPTADHATTKIGSKVAYTVPVHTTGTNVDNAFEVAGTISNATGGTNTFSGFKFDNVTGDAQVNVNAVNIGTGTTLGTSYAINIGSGWDLDLNGASGITETGLLTLTGGLNYNTVLVNPTSLTLPGRAIISICGDGTTINNNTIYYGPSMVPVANAMRTCDITQAGNATEATADAPAFDNTAFQVLSMDCLTADPGAAGVSFTLRNNAAATVPSVTCTTANTKLGCTANVQTTTAIAAGNPISIAAASTGNQGTTPFVCNITVAY